MLPMSYFRRGKGQVAAAEPAALATSNLGKAGKQRRCCCLFDLAVAVLLKA